MTMHAEITGLPELDRNFLAVGSGIGRVAKAGIFAGLGPMVKRMKALAPVNRRRYKSKRAKPGLLRRSIARRMKKDKRTGVSAGMAGINVGRKSGAALRAPHGHLVALGTSARSTKRGKSRGIMPANDFISRAERESEAESLEATRKAVSLAIEKEFAKQAKRGGRK